MADAGGGHHHQVKSSVLFRRNGTHLRISFVCSTTGNSTQLQLSESPGVSVGGQQKHLHHQVSPGGGPTWMTCHKQVSQDTPSSVDSEKGKRLVLFATKGW